jgi:hypothetical protein
VGTRQTDLAQPLPLAPLGLAGWLDKTLSEILSR